MPTTDKRFECSNESNQIGRMRVTDTLTGDWIVNSGLDEAALTWVIDFINTQIGVQSVEIRHVCVDKEA